MNTFSVYRVIFIAIDIYVYIIIARCLFSWFAPSPDNKIWQTLLDITEPVLQPLRNILPRFAMIDISPIVLIILLDILKKLLGSLLGYL